MNASKLNRSGLHTHPTFWQVIPTRKRVHPFTGVSLPVEKFLAAPSVHLRKLYPSGMQILTPTGRWGKKWPNWLKPPIVWAVTTRLIQRALYWKTTMQPGECAQKSMVSPSTLWSNISTVTGRNKNFQTQMTYWIMLYRHRSPPIFCGWIIQASCQTAPYSYLSLETKNFLRCWKTAI